VRWIDFNNKNSNFGCPLNSQGVYMITAEDIGYFQERILLWYEKFGRHFPWRNPSASNYEKIISEVLLQRTRAETVAKFFPGFLKKYPSWKKLGDATEVELIEAIQPLGLYNQRGKRLYGLAQEMKIRNGVFPKEKDKVEDISMMGQYLTNAYELFIQKRPSPLLDVNMARVLERYFGPRNLVDIRYDPYLQEIASKVVKHDKSKEINWGIIDLASSICSSKSTRCNECYLNEECLFYKLKFAFSSTAFNNSSPSLR
jgi:A/G-specific adenine glycosylase